MPIDWPDRGPLAPEELARPEDGVVLNRHPWVDREPSPWLATLREEPIRVRWTRPAGRGVVRAIESAGPDRSATGGDPPPAETGEIPPDAADPASVVRLVFVSEWTRETEASLETFPDPAGRAVGWGPPERPLDRHWGVRMRYRPASPGTEARGVLVHLHGLGGHGLERSVQAPLREAGWGVLECVYPLANWSRITVETTSEASIDAAAQGLAGIIDQRFGELAMGAEAALAALADEGDPAAAAGPVVVAAFSAGGNAAPAVIARLGERVRAAAIVVAGADLMRITVASGLGDTGLDAERNGRRIDRRSIRDTVRQELSERYLDRVQLDGWVLGPRLEPVPTLLVLGRFDAVVPTATGRLLRARLGEPETWWVLGGHVGTYVSLTWNGGRIGRWLRRHGAADEG